PTTIMMGASLKQTFSSFTGLAANRIDNSPGSGQLTIIGAADVYVSDFGKLTAVPNLFMRTRSVLLLDSKKAGKAWLRKIKHWPLAKQGDSTREQVLAEYTLQVENEAAHGIIADVQ
ncbi:MAG: DUF5309 domain-containing protein, partial [Rhodospirillales bacterium]|nr:DUF5309 domain-containing protein [Rhodospirillales bacterium]